MDENNETDGGCDTEMEDPVEEKEYLKEIDPKVREHSSQLPNRKAEYLRSKPHAQHSLVYLALKTSSSSPLNLANAASRVRPVACWHFQELGLDFASYYVVRSPNTISPFLSVTYWYQNKKLNKILARRPRHHPRHPSRFSRSLGRPPLRTCV